MIYIPTLYDRMKQTFFFIILFFQVTLLGKNLDVDVSFLLADIKYSKENGVKICEIQQGSLSTFYGDQFSHGLPGNILSNLYTTYAGYNELVLIMNRSITDPYWQKIAPTWPNWQFVKKLKNLKDATKLPKDPSDVTTYSGLIYVSFDLKNNLDLIHQKYPSLVILEEATFPFWKDKYKMSLLFTKNEPLRSIKPRWNLFRKESTEKLAPQIRNDVPSELLVIKPRGAFLGNGVIIIHEKDLEKTLSFIFSNSDALKEMDDPSYSYWAQDPFDTFIVEEFISSDPIKVEHLDGKIYQPTMRIAFVLAYQKEEIELTFLGGYYLLPKISLEENGSLNGRYKAYCKVPYFCPVEPSVLREVERELEEKLPLLYQEMLSY